MLRSRRFSAALGASALAAGLVLSMAGAADAVPLPAKVSCPKGHGNPYPPGQHCNAQLSASVVTPGQTITVTTPAVYNGGEQVSIDLHSAVTHLKTVPASSGGVVTTRVTIPTTATLGQHELTLDGLSSGDEVTGPLTVVAAGSSDRVLKFTGFNATPYIAGGAALVLLGLLALVVVRRRRSDGAAPA